MAKQSANLSWKHCELSKKKFASQRLSLQSAEMADLVKWCDTEIPDRVMEIMLTDLMTKDNDATSGRVDGQTLNTRIRDSKVYLFSANNWIGSFLWYYIEKINRQTFMYDIDAYDGNQLQYTLYEEGQFYGWHRDQDINSFYEANYTPTSVETNVDIQESIMADNLNVASEKVRKLSFSLQLNGDYNGGNLEFEDNSGKIHSMDNKQGRMFIFDSRTRHRVQPVTSNVRKSLVGWVVGPRWK
jgi:hypothetical protein